MHDDMVDRDDTRRRLGLEKFIDRAYQLSHGVRAQFRHRAGAVNLDGLLRRPDDGRDLLVEPPGCDQYADLRFTRSEGGKGLPECGEVLPLRTKLLADMNRMIDGVEEHALVERFLEEIDGTELHRPNDRCGVGSPGYKDGGALAPAGACLREDGEAVTLEQPDVDDQAFRLEP